MSAADLGLRGRALDPFAIGAGVDSDCSYIECHYDCNSNADGERVIAPYASGALGE
jgi:hypothetical protein